MFKNFKLFVTSIFKIPFLEKILVLPFIQKSRLNYWILRKIAPRRFQYEPLTIRKAKRNGIHYELDLSQHIEYSIYFGATNDKTRGKLYGLVKEDNVVIDIGTNIGEVLLNFAQLVGKNGLVYGFEPNPPIFERLKKNIMMNSFTNIQVFNLGLANEKNSFELFEILPENLGASRIFTHTEKSDFSKTNHITIHTIRLDEFVNEKQVKKIDLIKIDVEGFEFFVLQGAIETLKKWKPILFIELIDAHQKLHDFTARQVVDFLDSLGYQSYRADTDELISKDFNLENCVFDIYCVAK